MQRGKGYRSFKVVHLIKGVEIGERGGRVGLMGVFLSKTSKSHFD